MLLLEAPPVKSFCAWRRVEGRAPFALPSQFSDKMKHIARTWKWMSSSHKHRCRPLEYCKIIWTRHTGTSHGNSLMTSQFFGLHLSIYLNKLNFCSGDRTLAKLESFYFSSSIFVAVLNFNRIQLREFERFLPSPTNHTKKFHKFAFLHLDERFSYHKLQWWMAAPLSFTRLENSCQASMNTNYKIILKQIYYYVPEAVCKWGATNSVAKDVHIFI